MTTTQSSSVARSIFASASSALNAERTFALILISSSLVADNVRLLRIDESLE